VTASALAVEIQRLRGMGMHSSEVAEKLGISRQRVSQIAPLNGQELRSKWTAKRIRALRRYLKESQEGFAAFLGVRLNTVWRWEDGRGRPSWRSVQALEALAQRTIALRRRKSR